ncbi:uncharacterized protein KD926_003411 [Aspergillus affinis]|uniref:uncharacterized protein n=1 Tax=Aspergillus affinis TaxID=1070780 RepID=UPI0022FDDD58|nr:uncharacterized protein KD926_003411 [Aspergillus affinis]KAI9035514.1 hypothetical protein KD926_003411 [Aspergillus affinis]
MRSFRAFGVAAGASPRPGCGLGLVPRTRGVAGFSSSSTTTTGVRSALTCLSACTVSSDLSRPSRVRAPAIAQRRWYATPENIKQVDKKETKEHLERLEIKERDRTQQAKGNQKIENAMTNGKLLTTPSRLFKLLIPLPTAHHNKKHMDFEPIAILIHPQQPLSYLERLIQKEVPNIKTHTGELRSPTVSFIALQIDDNAIRPRKPMYEETDSQVSRLAELDSGDESRESRRDPQEDDDTFSYLRRPAPGTGSKEERFVRWSQSTEVGDFIRDASRAREFIVSIEGSPGGLRQIHVAVPAFDERTHFLRMRLRNISKHIQSIAEIKHECDMLAHRGAQRVAIGGFGILSFWWYLVYKLTFETDLGWDTMEPVTYLVSLTTLMGGYLWFLYHNREISYRSALDFTINARQKKLYQAKGVDLNMWESLIDEGNTLRKEIKLIAAEYDVYWDEKKDEQDERVTEALKKERTHKNGSKRKDDLDGDEHDGN